MNQEKNLSFFDGCIYLSNITLPYLRLGVVKSTKTLEVGSRDGTSSYSRGQAGEETG